MVKQKKISKKTMILLIGIPIIFILYLFAETFLFVSLDKAYETKIDIYAQAFCPTWDRYVFDYPLEEQEEKALKLYFLISDKIIEENQIPSYLECCDHLNLSCERREFKLTKESNLTKIVIVRLEDRIRYLDFYNPEDYVVNKFLNEVLIENE